MTRRLVADSNRRNHPLRLAGLGYTRSEEKSGLKSSSRLPGEDCRSWLARGSVRYVEQNLMPGEQVEYHAHLHWIIYVPSAALLLLTLVLFIIGSSIPQAAFAAGPAWPAFSRARPHGGAPARVHRLPSPLRGVRRRHSGRPSSEHAARRVVHPDRQAGREGRSLVRVRGHRTARRPAPRLAPRPNSGCPRTTRRTGPLRALRHRRTRHRRIRAAHLRGPPQLEGAAHGRPSPPGATPVRPRSAPPGSSPARPPAGPPPATHSATSGPTSGRPASSGARVRRTAASAGRRGEQTCRIGR